MVSQVLRNISILKTTTKTKLETIERAQNKEIVAIVGYNKQRTNWTQIGLIIILIILVQFLQFFYKYVPDLRI